MATSISDLNTNQSCKHGTLPGRIVTEFIQKVAPSVTASVINSQEIDFSNPLRKLIQPNLRSVTAVAEARSLSCARAPSPASILDVVSVILAIGSHDSSTAQQLQSATRGRDQNIKLQSSQSFSPLDTHKHTHTTTSLEQKTPEAEGLEKHGIYHRTRMKIRNLVVETKPSTEDSTGECVRTHELCGGRSTSESAVIPDREHPHAVAIVNGGSNN